MTRPRPTLLSVLLFATLACFTASPLGRRAAGRAWRAHEPAGDRQRQHRQHELERPGNRRGADELHAGGPRRVGRSGRGDAAARQRHVVWRRGPERRVRAQFRGLECLGSRTRIHGRDRSRCRPCPRRPARPPTWRPACSATPRRLTWTAPSVRRRREQLPAGRRPHARLRPADRVAAAAGSRHQHGHSGHPARHLLRADAVAERRRHQRRLERDVADRRRSLGPWRAHAQSANGHRQHRGSVVDAGRWRRPHVVCAHGAHHRRGRPGQRAADRHVGVVPRGTGRDLSCCSSWP